MTPLQAFFGGLLLLAMGVTVVGYAKGYGALSGRSRLYRTAGMGLVDLSLVLLLILVSAPFAGKVGLWQKLALLAAIILLLISLVALALLDALETYVVGRRARRQALTEAVQEAVVAAQERSTPFPSDRRG